MKADKKTVIRLLNTAKGQIDGIINMINDDKYCIEISNQLLSSIAILKRANIEILDAHLNSCVINANTKEEKEEKMLEISELLKKVIK
jgi:DNA-binding FrmR family transcriptional regulator